MPISEYDDIRATARLPNVDVDILHRRQWGGGTEQLLVAVQVVPPAEAFGRLLELSNPLLVWTRMMEAAWSPWMRALAAVLSCGQPSPAAAQRPRR